MKPIIKKYYLQGFECISIENETIEAAFLPELGGKMILLSDKGSRQQFLLEPQNEPAQYKKATYGSDFSHFDTSGFDECFPTVEESDPFPDHGEVWSRPWDCTIEKGEIILTIKGVGADYILKKRISLSENSIQLMYSVTNNMTDPLQYLWSAHPLFKIDPGVRIVLPDHVKNLFLNWSSDPSIGSFGDSISWPAVLRDDGNAIDLSTLSSGVQGLSVKCFSDVLREGFAGLYYPKTDRTVLFEFDPEEIPYAGLWICYGGWPAGAGKKHYTIGIEPCGGRPDNLAKAIQQKEHQMVLPGETKSWNLSLGIWAGLKNKTSDQSSQQFHSV